MPDSWPRKRIEAACLCAENEDSAVAWRTLRNLAAAYGCADLARQAHRRLEELEELDATGGGATTDRSPIVRDCGEIQNPKSKIQNPKTLRFKIDSPTPLARAAWLKKWCQFRGIRLESEGAEGVQLTMGKMIFPSISPTHGAHGDEGDRIMNMMKAHSEIIVTAQVVLEPWRHGNG